MLMDVLPGHGGIGDVNLLGIILGTASKRLVVGSAIREGSGLLAGRR